MTIHIETPCVPSRSLSKACRADVLLKLENCQPTGSFKLRGIGALCAEAAAQGTREIVSSSGGNAGIAAAYAGRNLGVPTRVYVPESTPEFMRSKIQAEDAQVIVHGKIWDEANSAALEDVKRTGACYVSPFDHPTIWAGNSTMIDELRTQIGKPGAVVAAVGGGGLLLGILEGLRRQGWDDVPVYACETEGTASFAATSRAGKLVTLPTVSGVATSLSARTVAAKLMDWIGMRPIESLVFSDRDAVQATLRFAEDHRYWVEPACGAALAAAYRAKLATPLPGPVAMIVCGGAVINHDKFDEWRSAYA
jgi:L-serine/L-threonine ammonia-lyase